MTDESVLTVWVVYCNPKDYPGRFVVRPQFVFSRGRIEVGQEPTAVVDSIDEARSHIPPGLQWFPRQPADDRTIVETWL